MTDVSSKTGFEYGWCHTDHKDGKDTGLRPDYFNDEPYASSIKQMLRQLGLPDPEPGEIYRGLMHDLLFLNSHGVALRIGPQDMDDLLNPGILQPLGWVEDKQIVEDFEEDENSPARRLNFTVAIYPGIIHYNNYPVPENAASTLYSFLEATGQQANDPITTRSHNTGVIRIRDIGESGSETGVTLLLDMDNALIASSKALAAKRARTLQDQNIDPQRENRADFMAYQLRTVFSDVSGVNAEEWHRAFEVHQPLRRMFWDAFRSVKGLDDQPDPAARDAFWDKCAEVTNHPQVSIVPVWRPEVGPDGQQTFVRAAVPVDLVLHRPWTREPEDRKIPPLASHEEVARVAHDSGASYPLVRNNPLRPGRA